MKRAVLGAAILAVCLHAVVSGQQAGQNINVLPIVAPADPLDPASILDAALKGDLYLQRQLEPTIAVSTRNPNTILAFYNNYGAVDIQNDPGLGEARNSLGQSAWNFLKRVFGVLAGRKPHAKGSGVPEEATASEAWVGGSRSYDGGITWSGMYVPGAPFDNSPASLASPVKGLEAATDPVLAAGPCGRFYLAFLAFTRFGASRMVVARYIDFNNLTGGDTIQYLGTTVIESANNAQWGYFLDKPSIAIDPSRLTGGDPCAHNVYVAYTTFNGLESNGKFRSKITFARSTDAGLSFAAQKLNMPFNQNQNTVIAVDPRDGAGGGTVYVAWRHFFGPDTILLHKSTNFGQTFSGQPVDLLSGSSVPLLQTFDQPTATTQNTANPSADVSFRTNSVPTLAVTGAGTLFAAWQERVDRTPGSATFGRPAPLAPGASPRIVFTRSTNGGGAWSERQAADMVDRDVALPAPGLGLLPKPRPSGPQVMPKLTFGGGRLLLTYYESRGFMQGPPNEQIVPADVTPPAPGFISGIDRVMDLRAAVLDPVTGTLVGSSQVSRYPVRTEANLADGEDLGDIAASNGPCLPDDPAGTLPCVRRVNHPNDPHSGSGTSPFIGDYVDATAVVQLVPRADGSGWRWATQPADVPYGGFHTIWGDNRNLVRPTEPAALPLAQRYPLYTTPIGGVVCTNSGSRNTDVLTSNVNAELVVSAPITFKQLEAVQRAFPVFAHNGTANTRFFRFSFATPAMATFASFDQVDAAIDALDVQLFPFSGATRVVYLPPSDVNVPVTVLVQETVALGGALKPGGSSGTASINADGSNPALINTDIATTEIYSPGIRTPGIRTPGIRTPGIRTPGIRTPGIRTPAIGETAPTGTVYAVTDVTWTVTNEGNTTAGYSSLVNIDNPEQYDGSYQFQLIVSKGSSVGGLDGCSSAEIGQDQVLVVIPNPSIRTPSIRTPGIRTPGIRTATFFIPPDESASASAGLAAAATTLAAAASNDGTTKAPAPPNVVEVTLRAYQMVEHPPVLFEPSLDPPSLAVLAQSCNTNGTCPEAFVSPDLAFSVQPFVSATTVSVGGTFTVTGGTVVNQGAGPAHAEDNQFQNSAFLVTGPGADGLFGTTDDLTAADTVFLGLLGSISGTVAEGQTVPFGGGTLTVPANTAPGTYTLVLMIDDRREVSEIDEINNVITLPFTVKRNTAPVAANRSVTTAEDTPVAILLTAADADGDTLTFAVVSGPSHGTLTGVAPALTYRPAANYVGPDSFTFRANDGALDSNVATVTITVTSVNDAPVANADAFTIAENSRPVLLDVLANDVDPEGSALTLTGVSAPTSGIATIVSGRISYTPALNFVGVATFTYTVSDGLLTGTGTVTITVEGGMADYGFIGLKSPWVPGAVANIGSAFPLVWQYTRGGVVVNSSAALPEVRIKGPYDCSQQETAATVEYVADPGSSGFQYFVNTNTWQFNWQTANLAVGCYNVRIFSGQTGQLNGPFTIRLRR